MIKYEGEIGAAFYVFKSYNSEQYYWEFAEFNSTLYYKQVLPE